jgi:hypothetical protein
MKSPASFPNMGAAGLALSVLEGSGIAAQLENIESSVNLSGGPPSIRLMVAESDYDRACELLRPLFERTPPLQNLKSVDDRPNMLDAMVTRAARFLAHPGPGSPETPMDELHH